MQVSIIIVNYNTRELLYNCLQSIYQQVNNIEFEVIVSDNGSTDGSVDMIKDKFSSVILLENNSNIGFGAANNKALKLAKGKYIFYLNSDTILLNNAVKIFYDFWENYYNEQILGVIGCILMNFRSEPVYSYGDLPTTKQEIKYKFFTEKKRMHNYDYSKPFEVGYITGAALFLKNNFFAQFDERFFLYFEETDLQYQLDNAGKKRLIIPGPKIIHLEGGSDPIIKSRKISFSNIQLAISRIKYLRKNDNKRLIIFILKTITLIKWINPFFISDTRNYIFQLIKV
jgi:GT2 family glycosyltransferase